MLQKISVLGFLLVTSLTAQAVPGPKLGTSEEQAQVIQRNRERGAPLKTMAAWPVNRPYAEFETTGFVAISGANTLEIPSLREAIARNLPQGVTLVVYVADRGEADALRRKYRDLLDESRLKFLVTPVGFWGNPIWGRDSLPFPVYMNDGKMGLVDSIYPQNFEPDREFAGALGASMTQTGFEFRGGNLLFDLDSNCWAENANEILGINDPEAFFKDNFGCKTVNILPHEGGIGDIDERVKFLEGKEALTDSENYARELRAKGYNVRMIPQTGAYYETYMNTLLVNNTIFVPQMGKASDQKALDAYRAYGFNPVGVYTKRLANEGHGNIHCLTMNYPPGTFVPSALGKDFVRFAPN